MAGSVLHVDVVRARLNSYTIITTLIIEVRQTDVSSVHGIYRESILTIHNAGWRCVSGVASLTKAIRVLHPILPIQHLRRRRITQNIIKHHISSIHNINAPQRWLLHEEILHRDIANIPEHEGHGPSGLRVPCFGGIPGVAVSVDATGAVAVDVDAVAGKDKAGMVVLEGDGIGVVAPV